MLISKSLPLLLPYMAVLQSSAATPLKAEPVAESGLSLPAYSDYPRTTIAGVSVVDTPIVRTAQKFIRAHSSDFVYKHSIRSWLFGTLIIAANETLRKHIDPEIHAVSAILHDIGWDQTPGSPFISHDKRFEVDGAIASREFLHENGDETWDRHRIQLVWDSIALHTQRDIAYYKELEVQVTSKGIAVDFDTTGPGVTKEAFNRIVKEFPNNDLVAGTNQTIIWLCQTKPQTTYDTWQQEWGDHYLDNYTTEGNVRFYHLFDNLL